MVVPRFPTGLKKMGGSKDFRYSYTLLYLFCRNFLRTSTTFSGSNFWMVIDRFRKLSEGEWWTCSFPFGAWGWWNDSMTTMSFQVPEGSWWLWWWDGGRLMDSLNFAGFWSNLDLIFRSSMLEYEIRSNLRRMVWLDLFLKHIHKAWDIW